MRLIDADELFNFGENKLSNAGKYGNKTLKQRQWSYSTLMMYEIADEIEGAPTAESAPVVHGEWVEAKINEMSLYPDGQKMCSVCGQIMPQAWVKMPPYCFGCGAKMGREA